MALCVCVLCCVVSCRVVSCVVVCGVVLRCFCCFLMLLQLCVCVVFVVACGHSMTSCTCFTVRIIAAQTDLKKALTRSENVPADSSWVSDYTAGMPTAIGLGHSNWKSDIQVTFIRITKKKTHAAFKLMQPMVTYAEVTNFFSSRSAKLTWKLMARRHPADMGRWNQLEYHFKKLINWCAVL